MAPGMPIEIIGIRPGEKLHEIMCAKDDSHLTIEFEDHFVIKPSFSFNDVDFDYSKNLLEERGVSVKPGFEYNSQNNSHYLTIEEIASLNENIVSENH